MRIQWEETFPSTMRCLRWLHKFQDDMLAQSFGGAHRGRGVRVCVHMVSICACIWALASVLCLKKMLRLHRTKFKAPPSQAHELHLDLQFLASLVERSHIKRMWVGPCTRGDERDASSVHASSSSSTNLMPNLLSSFSSLIYTTVLRFEISSTWKRCTSMLWFHSRDQFIVSSDVNAQFCVHVPSCFGGILLDSSPTIDRLEFPLTGNFIMQFHTMFVSQVFCFDDPTALTPLLRAHCISSPLSSVSQPSCSSLSTLTSFLLASLPASYYTGVVSYIGHLGILSLVILHWRCHGATTEFLLLCPLSPSGLSVWRRG